MNEKGGDHEAGNCPFQVTDAVLRRKPPIVNRTERNPLDEKLETITYSVSGGFRIESLSTSDSSSYAGRTLTKPKPMEGTSRGNAGHLE